MTGIITSLPPLIEQPPGNNASNPAGLPGYTYTVALLGFAQTWTAKQTFPLGTITLNAADITGMLPAALLNPLVLSKSTPLGLAPGAGFCSIQAVAGTNAGTCKIIIYAGTSATPITIVDNIGAGF